MSTDAMDEGAAEMGGMQIDIVQSEVNEPANEMEVIWCGWELQEAEDAYNEWMSDGCPHGGGAMDEGMLEKIAIAMWPHGEDSWRKSRGGTKIVSIAMANAAVKAIQNAGYAIVPTASLMAPGHTDLMVPPESI